MKQQQEETARSKQKEQARTVSRLFAKHGIDLSLVEAGRTLYQSFIQAKDRTKKDPYYIKKGIKFNFNKKPSLALIEVINGDIAFWQGWFKQQAIFDKTGLEDDRPTLHRLDPDGHYEFGNIGALPWGEHKQEHAVPLLIIDTDNLTINSYESITKMVDAEGIKQHKIDAVRASKKDAEKE
ncbi:MULTISPECIES: hypothetical protein [Lysinibacillus]|uniref:hypothetical protein n=1 Tax=Lysinibacillus TaxID=400634 RepID=UPI00214BC42E|nr:MULTISPECIES: hypothetical protein [Lysinibacillus]UUV23434.1 hypothetical protein NP781_16330 [Lysinibacillus sp. FN11]UYB46304.1 hypothetical protein OCI51_18940 [Lysinibacillus capsici]